MDYQQRIEQTKEALRLEETPRAAYDACADMDEGTMRRFVDYLLGQQEDLRLEVKAIRKLLEESESDKRSLMESLEKANERMGSLSEQLKDALRSQRKSERQAQKYRELWEREKRERYGKGRRKASASVAQEDAAAEGAVRPADDGHDIPDRQEERDNHDGTGNGMSEERPVQEGGTVEGKKPAPSSLSSRKNADLSNRPASYKVLGYNGDPVFHPSDRSRTGEPLATNIIRLFTLKMTLEAHDYETVKIRCNVTDPKTGKMKRSTRWVYMASEGHPTEIPLFKGTHATPELMQALAYEVYLKGTTFGNVHKWLTDLGMEVSKSTLNRWLGKGKRHLDKVLLLLKERAVEKDSVLNCDETWCKVRRYDHYRKCYLWVLVNREAKIVIFFYDNGSRGSDVLKDFLGEAEIGCLMTDGYVGYKFIGGSLEHWGNIDHVVCWAHIRTKIEEAIAAGCHDPVAKEIKGYIDQLFMFERQYREEGLAPEEILQRRQGPETKAVIAKIKSRMLLKLRPDEQEYQSPLFTTALNYMNNHWDEAVRYLEDGRYPIDNNAAERSVRPFCARRNSFEHFGSDSGVEMAACYHSIIGTLQARGVSVWHGLGKLFTKVIDRVEDFMSIFSPHPDIIPS